MTQQRADIIIANTMLLGGEVVCWGDRDCYRIEVNGQAVTASHDRKWKAASVFLYGQGLYVTPEGILERI